MPIKAVTRKQAILAGEQVEPITREEALLAGDLETPITPEEYFMKQKIAGGDSTPGGTTPKSGDQEK